LAAESENSTVVHCTAADGVTDVMHIDGAEPNRNVVVCLPAMGVDASYYAPLSQCLTKVGFAVARGELRGHGLSQVPVGRGHDFGYRELIEYSIPAMVAEIRARLSPKRVFLLGHSLGGHLAMLYASQPAANIDGFAMVASGTLHYRAWSGLQGMRILFSTQAAAAIANLLGYFPGDRLGFAGREPRREILDWARCGRTGRWQIDQSEHDYESLLSGVQLPVLAISLAGDSYAPRRSLDLHLQKMPQAKVTRVHLDAQNTPAQTLHHLRWARHPDPVVAQVKQWVMSLLAQ
jgi:predicted alpha/beta hydrolase